MARRAAPLSVNRSRSRPWFWRFMLVLGIALAIDFLVDDKLIFAGTGSSGCWRASSAAVEAEKVPPRSLKVPAVAPGAGAGTPGAL